VEEQIQAQSKAFDPSVEGYVDYVLGTSGKRIRPALSLLAGGACGEPGPDHEKLGIVLEMIHLATLVHDDIMDGADLRRSQPTAAARWGSALSVLLGDCLFAHALEMAASFDSTWISRKIARASNEVCSGEILQTQRRFDLALTIPEYFRIIRMKTAALFSAATELSAWLNGASEAVQENLRLYGELLGTAYQIYDDCLDLCGEEKQAGKTLGTDLVKGKLTLPILYLMEDATESQRGQLNKLILRQEPIDLSVVAGIANYAGAICRAVATARGMLAQARTALVILPANDYTTALGGITSYLDSLLDGCRPS
jgi:octaprenyl-diphosphate synthase